MHAQGVVGVVGVVLGVVLGVGVGVVLGIGVVGVVLGVGLAMRIAARCPKIRKMQVTGHNPLPWSKWSRSLHTNFRNLPKVQKVVKKRTTS